MDPSSQQVNAVVDEVLAHADGRRRTTAARSFVRTLLRASSSSSDPTRIDHLVHYSHRKTLSRQLRLRLAETALSSVDNIGPGPRPPSVLRLRGNRLLSAVFRGTEPSPDERRVAWAMIWAAWCRLHPHLPADARRAVRSTAVVATEDDIAAADDGATPFPLCVLDERLVACVPFEIRIRAALRWSDGPDVLELHRCVFHHLQARSSGADPAWRTRSLHVLQTFWEDVEPEAGGRLLDRLRDGLPDRAALVAACTAFAAQHRRGLHWLLPALNVFLAGGPLHGVALPGWRHWPPLSLAAFRGCMIRPSQPRGRIRGFFRDDEVAALTERCRQRGPTDLALLLTFLHTGLRTAAVCRLRWADVGLDDVVTREGQVLEKNGEIRRFVIDPVLADALSRHRAAQAQAQGKQGGEWVFPADGHGRRRTHHHNTRWLKRLCAECGIAGDHVYVHALRRTVVTRLMDAGNDIEQVRAWIGHRSVQQTQHYWERTPASCVAQGRMFVPWVDADPVAPREGAFLDPRDGPGAAPSTTASSSSMLRTIAEQYEYAALLDMQRRALEERIAHLRAHVLTAHQRAALGAWEEEERD